MHELSIAMSILDIAAEQAERHGGGRVAAIHLRLGALSGIVQEALMSAFDMARADSLIPNAQLLIEEVPVVVYCASCAAERTPTSFECRCPVCGTPTPEVRRGQELEISALEIET
jgi:hydrogenase nickel incorporation protein HypA/HybF